MNPEPPQRRQLWIGCVVFALFGFVSMLYMQGPGLTSGSKYHGDLTQSPHWIAYHGDAFAEDDLLVEYATYNESPVQNAIYWVGTFFVDVVPLNKIVGITIFGLTAALFFWLVSATSGAPTGALAAYFFVIFPRSAYEIAGGFSKAWAIGAALVSLHVVETRAWRILIWVMPLAALAYPMSAVTMGATVLVGILMEVPRSFAEAVRGFKFLCVGSALALGPLLYKYLTPPGRIGEMISTSEMHEVWAAGINRSTTQPLWYEALSYVRQPFLIYSTVLLLMLLPRWGLVWKRSWTALVISSTAFYYISAAVVPRLYLPDRYVRFGAALLLVLWFAHNWALLLSKIRHRWLWRAATLMLAVLAVVSLLDSFKRCEGDRSQGIWEDRSPFEELAGKIAELPDPVLVAGHPYETSDIMVQARKPVLVIHRMSHPWFEGYYQAIYTRNRDVFRALFATDTDVVDQLVDRYGVTHLVVKKSRLARAQGKRGNIYRPQYIDLIRELVEASDGYVLYPPPTGAVVYEDPEYWIVELPLGASGTYGVESSD